ncbi:MAG: DUF4922 domain-containing protein [Muribaculaceae bacterium]|nr:DUF4922 domain-containing protein [Muribaculaceae bacterium]
MIDNTLSHQVQSLVERQLCEWPLVRDNYAALERAEVREIWLGESRIILQHNPERIRSTAADVSDEAIQARPCFLCDANQPVEQEAVHWKSDDGSEYKIQVNPYPIFRRHLTISLTEHKPQKCLKRDMMQLAQLLPGYVIMFNGKGCGASAPDHLHFQATMQQELPLCTELEDRADNSGLDTCYGDRNLWIDGDTGRQLIYIRIRLIDSAILYDMSHALNGLMRNALCWFKDDVWHYVFFPRTKGRPQCYGTGEGCFLVSPAAAEYGGVWVLPRKQDFEHLTPELICSFYKELSINSLEMGHIYDAYVRVN